MIIGSPKLRTHPSIPLLFSIAAFTLTPAHAASFDCKKASTSREKTVCANPALSAQDDAVAAAYNTLRAHLSPASADLIRGDQREWLHFVDASCPASHDEPIAGCLLGAYRERLSQLHLLSKAGTAPVLYTRARFLLAPASAEDKKESGHNFGTGEFNWPQIDNPDPQQAAWNQAVFNAVVATANAGGDKKYPNTFESSVDSGGTVDLSATILALNDYLIEVDISNSTYGYGAAHPNTSSTSLLWLPQAGRALTPADVFRQESHWLETLVPIVIAKLKADGQVFDPPIYGKDDLRKSVATELANPAAWDLTRTSLNVTFGQYEVAPYSAGMPEVSLSWTSLKPYLNATFHPEELPARFPNSN